MRKLSESALKLEIICAKMMIAMRYRGNFCDDGIFCLWRALA